MQMSSVLNTSWGFSLAVAGGVVVGVGLIGAIAELVFPRGKPSVRDVSSVAEMKQIIAENERVVVHCGSMQYEPCQIVQPYFLELSAEFSNIKFLYADIDRMNKDFKDITKVPTFRMFYKGQFINEISGADIENIMAALSELSSQ
eukprot:TRINITY_DN114_c0_g1_i1.p1 TRINITY_DN114_c0_g1~~TRINITY_DN114_c0_g1_i1.p1  ORF type:complete len:145 (+),score=32.53 TRINITY_DN114_c0_g1_i1:37-471(+)